MVFNRFMLHLLVRLALIFGAMLAMVLIIGNQGRLFSVLGISLLLVLLVGELLHKISRTNRILESLLESIRYGDYSTTIREKASGMGFGGLADAAQKIVRSISDAKIEKEIQFQYLQTILDHLNTAVITLDREMNTQLINPVALKILGLFNSRNPTWEEIKKQSPRFATTIEAIGESGRKMLPMSNSPSGRQLLILVTTARIGEDPVRIITFQDIEPEIEKKEMESWQTISRIMAHEIMNSLTPLSSLTETGIMLLEEQGKAKSISQLTQQTIDNLHTALKTISGRNTALTQFIGNYRQLARLPLPESKSIQVAAILNEIAQLYTRQFETAGIHFTIHPGPGKFRIFADEAQVKQVLINLVKNAAEAISDTDSPEIAISSRRVMDHVAIEVSDNGPGIPDHVIEKIFVPFYSTKPEGSGIGLSLCRQIMNNHGGHISVESDPDSGTTFVVAFSATKQ